jgi:hypothetical protein
VNAARARRRPILIGAATVLAVQRRLAEAGEMSRSALAAELHMKASDLASVIGWLVAMGQARVERRGTFGRPCDVVIWTGEAPRTVATQLELQLVEGSV